MADSPDTAMNVRAARLARRMACVLLVLAVAACSTGGPSITQPFSKSTRSSARTPPPIAVVGMAGLPPAKAALLSEALTTAAARRDIAIVQGNFTDGYSLAGQFAAVPQGSDVRITYEWKLTGNAGGQLMAIPGSERVPAGGPDPWAGADGATFGHIAEVTAENLSSKLQQLGYTTRTAGLPPPGNVFASPGPGAEHELDEETLMGPAMALAVASEKAAAKQDALSPASMEVAGAGGESAAPANDGAASGNAIAAVAVAPVEGASGRGNGELRQAMTAVLERAGWPVVESPREDAIIVEGHVGLGPSGQGNQRIALAWTVKLPDGRVLGTIKQANEVPSGSLDGGWGDTATFAAEAAADGIFDLVSRLR